MKDAVLIEREVRSTIKTLRAWLPRANEIDRGVIEESIGRLLRYRTNGINCPDCKSASNQNGKSASGAQRYRCLDENCGRTFVHPMTYKRHGGGNRIDSSRRDNLIRLLRSGRGIRNSARLAHVCRFTARVIWMQIRQSEKIMCGCGREITHKGWCKVRFQRSAKRQKFVRKWHEKFPNR